MRVFSSKGSFQVRLFGESCADFLQRMTSNNVKSLEPGDRQYNCFLTPKGKIIVPFEMERKEAEFIFVGPLDLADTLVGHIEKYRLMDDVQMERLDDIPASGLSEGERIRKGLLEWGRDVTAEMNPWEAGLLEYFSLSKGCYAGQEVIMRIKTYGQGQTGKKVVRLCSDRESPAGVTLQGEERASGTLTSVAAHPERDGVFIAFGTVNRPAFKGGTRLKDEEGTEWEVLEEKSEVGT